MLDDVERSNEVRTEKNVNRIWLYIKMILVSYGQLKLSGEVKNWVAVCLGANER